MNAVKILQALGLKPDEIFGQAEKMLVHAKRVDESMAAIYERLEGIEKALNLIADGYLTPMNQNIMKTHAEAASVKAALADMRALGIGEPRRALSIPQESNYNEPDNRNGEQPSGANGGRCERPDASPGGGVNSGDGDDRDAGGQGGRANGIGAYGGGTRQDESADGGQSAERGDLSSQNSGGDRGNGIGTENDLSADNGID